MRIMHTMLRVGDLDRSIEFYCDILGMTLLRRIDVPEGKFSLGFVGYAGEEESSVLELTHNWGQTDYQHGDAFGHVAIGVDDVYAACRDVARRGGRVVREAGPMQDGETVIAFLQDPDGYQIELLALEA